jgi:DNA-binding Xre family transcriptional regulator
MTKTTIDVVWDGDEAILQLTDKMCEELGWNVGDTIKFTQNEDGTITLNKLENEYDYIERMDGVG